MTHQSNNSTFRFSDLAILVTVVPAASFLSGYFYNIGFFTTLGGHFSSLLTLQDYVTSSLTSTSLASALFVFGAVYSADVIVHLAKRIGVTQSRFWHPSGAPIGELVLTAAIAIVGVTLFSNVPQLLRRSGEGATETYHLVIASAFLSAILLITRTVIEDAAARLKWIVAGGAIATFAFSATVAKGGADVINLESAGPAHSLGTTNNFSEDVVLLRILDRGLVVDDRRLRSKRFIPWSEVRSIRVIPEK